jgi:branched-chain amino acid aminotransferase
MKAYINGELKEKEEISEIFEPGFLFGWGVFEPLRVYGGKTVFLNDHLTRLKNSCKLLSLDFPEVEWEAKIKETLSLNKLKDAYLRLTIYKKRKGVGVIIYADDFKYYASDAYSNGFTTVISAIRRNENDLSCRVKTTSYLNNRLAWAEAQAKGKDEALMLNLKGNLAGGARSNLFIVKDSFVLTPLLKEGAFCGITRLKVMKILRQMNLKVKEAAVKKSDLVKADEAFLTSSLLEVMPLVSCDNHKIGGGLPGKITSLIREQYHQIL